MEATCSSEPERSRGHDEPVKGPEFGLVVLVVCVEDEPCGRDGGEGRPSIVLKPEAMLESTCCLNRMKTFDGGS